MITAKHDLRMTFPRRQTSNADSDISTLQEGPNSLFQRRMIQALRGTSVEGRFTGIASCESLHDDCGLCCDAIQDGSQKKRPELCDRSEDSRGQC